MTRFGVMKHLKVLEEAGLVTTKRRGREKLHFLNPVPIRLVHDRWVSKYAEPWARAGLDLKTMEEERMDQVKWTHRGGLDAMQRRSSRSTSRRRPSASGRRSPIPSCAAKYNFGVGVSSDWTEGSGYEAVHPSAGMPSSPGENLEVDPPRRLVQSFTALWSDEVKGEGTSRVTWEIEPVGDSCRLTVTHDQLPRRRRTASCTAAGR